MRYIFALLLFVVLPANAVIETYEFEDESKRQRYHQFTDELRCPKCQNQNLSGSNSPIAQDLRRELHRLLQEGHEDQQIVEYMVARYGEFILYRPRFNIETAILWLAPIVFLSFGVIVLAVIAIRQKNKARLVSQHSSTRLDETERDQLDDLLNEEDDRSNTKPSLEVNHRG